MEATLLELKKKSERRGRILSISTTIIFLSLLAFIIIIVFDLNVPIYAKLSCIGISIICIIINRYEINEIKKEINHLAERVNNMQFEIGELIEKLTTKRKEFDSLNPSLLSEEEYQVELIKYSEFVFCSILNRVVEITGVYPDEPVFLKITTKEDIEELFNAASLILTSVQGALHSLYERLKNHPIYQ